MSDHPPVRLTGLQKNAYLDRAEDAPVSPAFARCGSENPNLRVFVANFDGTENMAGAARGSDRDTLVAESHNHFSQIKGNIHSIYVPGVGTTLGRGMNKLQSIFGFGCKANAERAYKELVAAAEKWADKNPGAEVHVHAVGFSRGSATALHFMNLVDQRGIAGVNFPKMAPGEVKSSAVLYDTVSTGVEDLTLTLPDSNISTLHIVAGGEERIAFKLSSLVDPRRNSELAAAKNVEFKGGRPCPDGVLWYRRLHEITLPGARHSDIGGSYPDGGIRALSAYLCRRFQSTLGLPIRADRPDLDAVQAMHAHDSRIVTMEHSHEIRQNAWREMASLPASSWDGTYSEHCTGSFIPSNHGRSEGMRIVRSAPSDQARGVSEGDLGGHLSVTWRLVPCPDGQRPRVVVEGCRDFTFNDLGELMYRDARILSGPTRDEVAAELNRAKIAHLNVSFEKAISPRPHDAKQSVSDSSMERAPDRDRWQRNVESAVRAANEHGSYMPVEGAEALVRDAVENATMVLRERFPEVRGVAVRIRPSSEHGGDSVIAVTCARRPGADFTQSKDLLCGFDDVGQADLPLAEFVQTVRAGLRSIVKSLAEQSGMPTPRGAFEFGHVSLPAGRLGAPTVGLSVLVAPPLGASDAVTGDRDDHSSGERCQHLRVVR